MFGCILYEMTGPGEDFRAMFEASTQPKRFESGQTVEGTVVAIARKSRSSTSAGAKPRQKSTN